MPYMRLAKRSRYGKRPRISRGPTSRKYRLGALALQNQAMRNGPRSISRGVAGGSIKRVMTQMTSDTMGQISIYTLAGGSTRFFAAGTFGTSLQMAFSLQQTEIYLGPAVVASLANPGYLFQTGSFQRYRLDRIEVSMYVGSNTMTDIGSSVAQPQAVTQLAQPMVMYVVDSDDTAPLTQNQILSYGNMQLHQPTLGKPLQCSFRPSALTQLGDATGAANLAGTTFSPIISCDFPNTAHLGIKFVPTDFSVFPGAGTYQCAVNFVIKYHMSFFDPK